MQSKVYVVPNYIQNPIDPIKIVIIGCGGTGSEFARRLARIAYISDKVHNNALQVTIMDPDTVSVANMGRQLFFKADEHRYKSDIMVERINRSYGLGWNSIPQTHRKLAGWGNIIITCVDSALARREIAFTLRSVFSQKAQRREWGTYLWIDTGNDFNRGNVIMTGFADINKTKLPDPLDIFGEINDTEDTPSCSLAEAIGKQHPMINDMVALLAADLLLEVLTKSYIDKSGYFVDMETKAISTIPIGYYDKIYPSGDSERRGVSPFTSVPVQGEKQSAGPDVQQQGDPGAYPEDDDGFEGEDD